MFRIISIAALIISLVLFPPAALAYISNNAVPGDITYPIKRKLEDIILLVSNLTPQTKTYFAIARSQRRFTEANNLIDRGKNAKGTLQEFNTQTGDAVRDVQNLLDSKQKKDYADRLSSNLDKYKSRLTIQSQRLTTQSLASKPDNSSAQIDKSKQDSSSTGTSGSNSGGNSSGGGSSGGSGGSTGGGSSTAESSPTPSPSASAEPITEQTTQISDIDFTIQQINNFQRQLCVVKGWIWNASSSTCSDPSQNVGRAPSAPSNLSATAVSANRVNLSWTAPADPSGVTGYIIVRNGASIDQASTTSYSDTTTSEKTQYTYQVQAINAAGYLSDPTASASVTTPSCFLAGTEISTPNGQRAIETLQAGDQIYSLNEVSKQKQISVIGQVLEADQPEYLVINERIHVTPHHPFYAVKNSSTQIVEAGKLQVGDHLISESGSLERINQIEKIVKTAHVYNLVNVSPNHNYFADQVLVHNKLTGGPPPPAACADPPCPTPDPNATPLPTPIPVTCVLTGSPLTLGPVDFSTYTFSAQNVLFGTQLFFNGQNNGVSIGDVRIHDYIVGQDWKGYLPGMEYGAPGSYTRFAVLINGQGKVVCQAGTDSLSGPGAVTPYSITVTNTTTSDPTGKVIGPATGAISQSLTYKAAVHSSKSLKTATTWIVKFADTGSTTLDKSQEWIDDCNGSGGLASSNSVGTFCFFGGYNPPDTQFNQTVVDENNVFFGPFNWIPKHAGHYRLGLDVIVADDRCTTPTVGTPGAKSCGSSGGLDITITSQSALKQIQDFITGKLTNLLKGSKDNVAGVSTYKSPTNLKLEEMLPVSSNH